MSISNLLKPNYNDLFCDKLTCNTISVLNIELPDEPGIPVDINLTSLTLHNNTNNTILTTNATSNYTIKLPTNYPQIDNQVLTSDTQGNTSWTTINITPGTGNLVFFQNSTKAGTSLGYNVGESTFLSSGISLNPGFYVITINTSFTLSGNNKGAVAISPAAASTNVVIIDTEYPRIINFNNGNQYQDYPVSISSKIQIVNTFTINPYWGNVDNTLSSGAGISTIVMSWADITIFAI